MPMDPDDFDYSKMLEDQLPLTQLQPTQNRILRVQEVDVTHRYLVDTGHGFEVRSLPEGAV
jgi:hypothetical protein